MAWSPQALLADTMDTLQSQATDISDTHARIVPQVVQGAERFIAPQMQGLANGINELHTSTWGECDKSLEDLTKNVTQLLHAFSERQSSNQSWRFVVPL